MKIRLKILSLVLLCVYSIYCKASHFDYPDNQADSANSVIQGQFRQELIDAFKEDSSFNYELPPGSRPGLLKLIFSKFFEWLLLIFGNEFFAWLVVVALVIVGVIGLIFALYGLFGIGKTVPIYAKEVDKLLYTVKEENIHEIDFQEEIDNAVSIKEFKKAVRLVYLYGLRILSDRQIIEWSPSKTNHEYLYEIPSENHKNQFSRLCYFFEYVWYGDFKAGRAEFEEINNILKKFKSTLRQDA